MHRPTVKCYLEGSQDLLFELHGFGHQLREGDLFSFDPSGSGPIDYRVESAKLEMTEATVGTPSRDAWAEPILRVEVSVVP